MKWYVFNDDGKSKTVNLLLDHNTTAEVAWASSRTNANGPVEVKTQLESDTSSWNKSINPRLIEASEIAKITGYPNWNNKHGKWYYFHDTTQTRHERAAGTNKYAWLFDNTRECTTYGCNVADSSNDGYWTNNAYSGDSYGGARAVAFTGYLGLDNVNLADICGVRPVITVLKSIIS